MKTIQKILAGTPDIRPIQYQVVLDIFTRLYNEGWMVYNQTSTVHAQQDSWVLLFSKVSKSFQCYFLGYGHCTVSCSLQDFRDADHIYLWQKEQKLVEPTKPPADEEEEIIPKKDPQNIHKKRLSPEQVQDLVEELKAGRSQASIARMFGISTTTVSYYRNKFL